MTPPATVNRMQDNIMLYRVIDLNHIYISIYVDF